MLHDDIDIRSQALATNESALAEIAKREWELREVSSANTVYTDDLAPVERLIDDIIVREALGGRSGRQR